MTAVERSLSLNFQSERFWTMSWPRKELHVDSEFARNFERTDWRVTNGSSPSLKSAARLRGASMPIGRGAARATCHWPAQASAGAPGLYTVHKVHRHDSGQVRHAT